MQSANGTAIGKLAEEKAKPLFLQDAVQSCPRSSNADLLLVLLVMQQVIMQETVTETSVPNMSILLPFFQSLHGKQELLNKGMELLQLTFMPGSLMLQMLELCLTDHHACGNTLGLEKSLWP